MAMIVGVCRLSLHFPESGSLKDKRHGLRKLIDRVRAKFNAAVAEVAEQDTWQRATVGLVVVGNESRHVQSMLDNIISFAESLYVAEIFERQVELVTYSDSEPLAGPADAGYPRAGWEPEPIRRPQPRPRPLPRPQRRRP